MFVDLLTNTSALGGPLVPAFDILLLPLKIREVVLDDSNVVRLETMANNLIGVANVGLIFPRQTVKR